MSDLTGGELVTERGNSSGTATQEPDREDQAIPEADEVVHLGKAAEEELKRLATHPVEEVEHLGEEIREGKSVTGLFAFVGGVALSMWFLAALLMTAVFLVAYFVGR